MSVKLILIVAWIFVVGGKVADVQRLYEQGYHAFTQQRYADAVHHYSALLEHSSLPARIRSEASFSLGLAYKALERYSEAVAVLRPLKDARAKEVLVSCLSRLEDPASKEEATQILISATTASAATGDDFYALATHLKQFPERLHDAARIYIEAIEWLRTRNVPAKSIMPRKGGGVWRWAVFIHSAGKLLTKLNRTDEALELYKEGVQLGLWVDPYQRYLRPLSHPPFHSSGWITRDSSFYPLKLVELLEANFKMIQADLLSVLDIKKTSSSSSSSASSDGFQREPEYLHDSGYWDVFQFVENGRWSMTNKAEKTKHFLQSIPQLGSCIETECDVYFSRLKPQTHIEAHCGPTLLRLRLHLGLIIPPIGDLSCQFSTVCPANLQEEECCKLRVGNVTRRWEEGRVLVFDDSFEHEVWHDGLCGDRVVLSVDIAHPNAIH